MSCLTPLGSQIITFVSVPYEVLSLQHQVFQEYVKVALGPDFTHTFPSLIIITAVCIILRRYLSIKWWPRTGVKSLFHNILKLDHHQCGALELVNSPESPLLHCLDILDKHVREIYLPWWRKVWSSFNPPTAPPPIISASLISWIITMILASIVLLGAIFADNIAFNFTRAPLNIHDNIDGIGISEKLIVKRENEMIINQVREEIDATDKSEVGSFCDECNRLEGSTDMTHRTITQREISPICYGTNWIKSNGNNKKSQRELSCKTLADVSECLMADDQFLPRPLRNNRRSSHTLTPSSCSDKSISC
ncbi:hypothetical protein PV325_014169 [Microctonus aethiopoides]|nr:hypothetical protein PV325_014169 [Microctonus aethiopoides]